MQRSSAKIQNLQDDATVLVCLLVCLQLMWFKSLNLVGLALPGDIYFPCKEEQNTVSNLSKSISLTSNSRKFWTALLEMSGEELLGLLAEGVPDSAAAATALPLKRAEEFNMAAFCAKQSSIDHPHEPGHTDACLG